MKLLVIVNVICNSGLLFHLDCVLSSAIAGLWRLSSFGGRVCATTAYLWLLIDCLTTNRLDLSLQFDDFIWEVPVLDLDLLEWAIIEADSVAVLFLPLFSDLLLLDHDLIGTLFVAFVALLGLQELVLKVGHLDVALIIELIDAAMENDLESV